MKRVSALDGVILEDGHNRPRFIFTIYGHNTSNLDMPVTEKDVIAIFLPIAGE